MCVPVLGCPATGPRFAERAGDPAGPRRHRCGVPATGLQIAVAVHRARHGAAAAATSTRLTVAVTAGTLAVVLPVATVLLRLTRRDATLLIGRHHLLRRGRPAGGSGSSRVTSGSCGWPRGWRCWPPAGTAASIAGLLAGAGLTGALLAGAAASALVPAVAGALARNRGARCTSRACRERLPRPGGAHRQRGDPGHARGLLRRSAARPPVPARGRLRRVRASAPC